MRFKRYSRMEYNVTNRKRAALERKHRREQQAVPLLAELIVEQQPTVDAVMADRVRQWDAIERQRRDTRAADWRRARSQLASLPTELKSAMLQYWNDHRWLPGDPSYLADAIHRLRTGRLVFVDGRIVPDRVTIATAEAESMSPTRKPVTKGWLARRG